MQGFLSRSSKEPKKKLKTILDIGSIFAQLCGFFVWPVAMTEKSLYMIPVALLFISFQWWENFVSKASPFSKLLIVILVNCHKLIDILFF